jgi:hypothetical protein
MFTSSLSEEVKALEEDIAAVKEKVDDPIMCEKVKQFVYASKDIQDLYKADAGKRFHHSCYCSTHINHFFRKQLRRN